MAKPKRDPWLNKAGIRVMGRATVPTWALVFNGFHDDGSVKLTRSPIPTLVSYTPK